MDAPGELTREFLQTYQCPICQDYFYEQLAAGEDIDVLKGPHCDHLFHEGCIKEFVEGAGKIVHEMLDEDSEDEGFGGGGFGGEDFVAVSCPVCRDEWISRNNVMKILNGNRTLNLNDVQFVDFTPTIVETYAAALYVPPESRMEMPRKSGGEESSQELDLDLDPAYLDDDLPSMEDFLRTSPTTNDPEQFVAELRDMADGDLVTLSELYRRAQHYLLLDPPDTLTSSQRTSLSQRLLDEFFSVNSRISEVTE